MEKMTLEEFKEAQAELKKEYLAKVSKLNAHYATVNNPFKIGDIIEDQNLNTRIKIEKIEYSVAWNSHIPYSVYTGPQLKKDNTPFKKGNKESLYQCNPLKKIEVDVDK